MADTTTQFIVEAMGISHDKCVSTFKKYGNTAAASTLLALQEAIQTKKLQPGQKLMILGLAAGISISVQFIEWNDDIIF